MLSIRTAIDHRWLADQSLAMPGLCRDCFIATEDYDRNVCPRCGSARWLEHDELGSLAIAHLDCDAFYATVEKRDNPTLADKPVLVGGSKRGVVMAACYVARQFGIGSAMPMYKALRACPDAVIIRPDIGKYAEVGREVRAMMGDATPAVEAISIDEAFLDLSGTQRLHRASPAQTVARLVDRIEREIGITVSIGLSYNKFLAKVASGLSKPRGFQIIGRAEAAAFLAQRPVSLIWGIGEAMEKRLGKDGITRIGELQHLDEADLEARYGKIGRRLSRFSRGLDDRHVVGGTGRKSLSAESTFAEDLRSYPDLSARLWRLCEKVSRRLKDEDIGARTITLKLKNTRFQLKTRSTTLRDPTQLADVIFRAGSALLEKEADGTPYRLIGIGTSHYAPASDSDPPSLADPDAAQRRDVEHAIDKIRTRFGETSIGHGRRLPVGGAVRKPKPN